MDKKGKKFKPTIEQIKYANLYCDVKSRINTDTDRAKKIGTSRMSINRWKNNPDFISWLEDRAQKTVEKAKGILMLFGIKQALKVGGFNYWKVLMEITGLYAPNLKIEALIRPPELPFMYYKDDKAIEAGEVKKIEGENGK